MTLTTHPAPVRKTVKVRASQAHAFAVFTEGFGRWWPASHSIGKSPIKHAVLEPHVGGRWYEVGEDGSECQWGRVLEWQPPARVLLAWQINGQWQYDSDLVTEVEVNFYPEEESLTRVELEHRLLERFGDKAEAIRAMIDAPGGWGGIMDLYVQACAG